MKSGTIHSFDAGKALVKAGQEALRFKSTLNGVMGDGAKTLRRTMKKSQRALGHLADEAAYKVRKQPLKSVGIAFGVAFVIGALTGRLTRRG